VSIDIQPRAQFDMDLAQDELLAVSAAAARAFESRIRRTLELLESQPYLGEVYDPPAPRHPGLRFFPVSRFTKYIIYYTPTADGIAVVRVLHASRNIAAILNPPS
jgi:toxin ParE1/3/4